MECFVKGVSIFVGLSLLTKYNYEFGQRIILSFLYPILGNKQEYSRTHAIYKQYFKTQPITRAWLFGSYSRGEETPDSDVDILVQYTDSDRISLFTISRIASALRKIAGRRVDLVEEGCLLPFAEMSANRDKVLIYEREDSCD